MPEGPIIVAELLKVREAARGIGIMAFSAGETGMK
jgi:hypothetical protein